MRYILIFLLFLSAGCPVSGQSNRLWVIPSSHLSAPDSVAVILPAAYDSASAWPVVYLLHGYGGNHSQWMRVADCQQLANTFGVVIICPDGFNSWYVNSKTYAGSHMEDFFFRDLVPYVHSHIHVDSANVFISGLSMGGYGALRYFILHQDYFNAAASSSGALTADYSLLHKVSNRLTADIKPHLGDPQKDWPRYGIPHLLRTAKTPIRPFLIDCGREDMLISSHMEVARVADSLHLPATVITQPGNHSRPYWHDAIWQHFVYFKTRMGTN